MKRVGGNGGMGAGWWRRAGARRATAVLALVATAALLALAGCDSSAGAGAQATVPASAGTTVTVGTASGTAGPAQTPTTSAVTTPGAQQGTAEFCAATATVSAQLPASVPAYPGAQLRLGQSSGGSGIYGLCSGDSVSAVAQFYAAQLPAKGWQQVTTSTNGGVQQVQAGKGSTHVVVTVEPDAQLSGTSDIIILTTGM